MRTFPELMADHDAAMNKLDATLALLNEPLTVESVMGAVNLRDAMEAHWSKPVTSPSRLDAIALAKAVI